jgi:hypothetical protein
MTLNYSTSSGPKTEDSQITTIGGGLCGVDFIGPEAGYAELVIYDSATSDLTGKTAIAEFRLDAGFLSLSHEYTRPLAVNSGLYCTLDEVGGTGSKFYVRYIIG